MLEKAQKDYLTGFYTREALDDLLQTLVLENKMHNDIFSLAVIDIDRFKKFNDRYGHTFGDEVLKYAASTLRLMLSQNNCYLFRYGGDEFVVILSGKKPEELYHLLKRCNYTVRHRAFLLNSRLFKITMSCGIAGFPDDAITAEALVEKADKAMYFSKRHGFNLTTLASRIKYIKLRNALAVCCVAALMIVFLYQLSQQAPFKKMIKSITDRPTHTKVVTIVDKDLTPVVDTDLRTVVLKNGNIYEGHILSEDKDTVVLNMKLKEGQGTIEIPKSRIVQIKNPSDNP